MILYFCQKYVHMCTEQSEQSHVVTTALIKDDKSPFGLGLCHLLHGLKRIIVSFSKAFSRQKHMTVTWDQVVGVFVYLWASDTGRLVGRKS